MKHKISIIVTLAVVIASASLTLASDTPQAIVKLDLSKDLITFLKFGKRLLNPTEFARDFQ